MRKEVLWLSRDQPKSNASLSSPTWVFQNWEAFWQGLSLALEDAGPWEGGSDEDPSRAGEESTGLQGQQRGGVQGV
jgi:hypothetical protein